MKLVSLKIDSFGGISDVQVTFNPRFTLIQGPNEAGKSTIFNALKNLLLTDVSLTKPVFRKSMQRFLPLAGGDTIGAELEFIHEGEQFTLRKRWGESSSVQLTLPGGARVTEGQEVKRRLGEMLPSGEGTIKHIFLTSQTGLGDTLERLSEDPEILFSFSDLLKRAVLEAGGVSLAKFEDTLAARHAGYFKRWDRLKQYPEGGRGVHNPYKTGLGHIVDSYYKVEKLKSFLTEAQNKEQEYEVCEKEYNDADRQLGELEGFLEEHAVLYQQAREAVAIEGDLTRIIARAEALKTDNERWPIVEIELKNHESGQVRISQDLAGVRKEREKAEHIDGYRKIADQYERALKKKKTLEEKKKRLEELKPVDPDLLEEARRLSADLQHLRGVLSSQTLRVDIQAKNPVSFLFSPREGGGGEKITLAPGENAQLTGSGGARVESEDLILDIFSGDEESRQAEKRYGKKKKREEEILTAFGAGNLGEIEQLSAEFEKALQEVRAGEENLELELEGVTFEALAAEIKEGGLDEKTRPLGKIIEEQAGLENQEKTLGKEKEQLREELEDLKEKYDSRESLFQSMIDAQVRKKELEESLPGPGKLPRGVDDFSAFIKMYEKKQKEREGIKDRLASTKNRKDLLEAALPDESTVEIEAQLKRAVELFERNLRQGEALEKIMEAAGKLTGQLDNSTDGPFQELFTRLLKEMTSDKYGIAVMDEDLPVGIGEHEGQTVPHAYLSAGTKDTFSLALKLAMVKTFLRNREGFFILDDPLVDMDPRRQKSAAAALSEFARDIQVIFFTCHPAHADLFKEAEIIQWG